MARDLKLEALARAPLFRGVTRELGAGVNVRVAGKTGTAALSNGSGLTQAWFAGYAPGDAPELAHGRERRPAPRYRPS